MLHHVLSVEEMQNIDFITCQQENIALSDLVQRAGYALFHDILKYCHPNPNQDAILVLAGEGNNGRDALVVAHHLTRQNYQAVVAITALKGGLSKEYQRLLNELPSTTKVLFLDSDYEEIKQELVRSKYLIDGMLGTGLKGELADNLQRLINDINQSNIYVISIDIPSGINGNSGKKAGVAIVADLTLIIQNYKYGNLLNDAKDHHGISRIVDIGINQQLIASKHFYFRQVPSLPKRKHNTHKYHYGSILTIGGSFGMMGAVHLASMASLKSGSGLATLAIKEKYLPYYHQLYPELITKTYANLNVLKEIIIKKDAIIFGPGLGRNDDENYSILEYLLTLDIPIVIDADGLFYLKPYLDQTKNSKIVITPHQGEFAMLLDKSVEEVKNNPIQLMQELAEKTGMAIVLKGPCTIIGYQNELYFNDGGNPGMATAGSGDVLSGMIASFLGQGFDVKSSCLYGVYYHSQAGKLSAQAQGEYSMIASDIIHHIGTAIKQNQN